MIIKDKNFQCNQEFINKEICKTSGKIYVELIKDGYNPKSISDEFLKSDFCRREFDTIYSIFQLDDDASIYYFLKECKNKLIKEHNKTYQILDIIYWIGFMYRYIYIQTGIASSEICDIIPYEEMNNYIMQTMYPYEEYSEDEIFDMIDKDKQLSQYQ